jgi:hypothetical protein
MRFQHGEWLFVLTTCWVHKPLTAVVIFYLFIYLAPTVCLASQRIDAR